MGAPPGLGDVSSKPLPKHIPKPGPDPGSSSADPLSPSGPGAPPPAAQESQALPPPNALALMGLDEKRIRLARGLRLFNGQHWDGAKLELSRLGDNPLAREVVGQIQKHEALFHARQIAFVVKALAQDSFQAGKYSETERLQIFQAVDQVESEMIASGKTDLGKAIAAAKLKLDPATLATWNRFSETQATPLAELSDAFLETDPELLAKGLLRLAEAYRERKLYGTAWALAQLAAEHPQTEKAAKDLSSYLEGKRLSTEYVVSDMFDHGGSAMAIDLLALVPSVALTRRLSTVGWLARRSGLIRVPLTLLAGGAIHWGSSKAIQALSGYDGQIMPRSLREFGGEFASSTLQNGLALFLANRKLMWGRPMATREAAAAIEAAESSTVSAEATQARRAWPSLLRMGAGKLARGAWWTAKTGTKLSLISVADLLLAQAPLHYFGVDSMTPQGLPEYALKLFPKTREARLAVAENYGARRLFRDYQKHGDGGKKVPTVIPGVEAGLDLDLFLTQLDPGIENGKREAAYAVLAEAAAGGKLGLNIRRWVLQKKKLGELAGANRTFERQGIPLRYEQDGSLCFTDSKDYPCPEPPAEKP
ncbi:MAG: hypothetical protein U1F66_03815 [bacterium]